MENPKAPGEMETQQVAKLPEADKRVLYNIQRSLVLVAYVERHNLPDNPILLRTDDSDEAHAIRDAAVKEWMAEYAKGRPPLARLFEQYYEVPKNIDEVRSINPQNRDKCSEFIKKLIDFGEHLHNGQQLA